jgi:hypothetical protein
MIKMKKIKIFLASISACAEMKYFFNPFWLFLTRFGLSDFFGVLKTGLKIVAVYFLVKF